MNRAVGRIIRKRRFAVSSTRIYLASSALIAASIFALPALAFKAYHLEGQLYAIVCDNGVVYSYSGSSEGIGTVGPALCKVDDSESVGPSGSDAANPPRTQITRPERRAHREQSTVETGWDIRANEEARTDGVEDVIKYCSPADGAIEVAGLPGVLQCPNKVSPVGRASPRRNAP